MNNNQKHTLINSDFFKKPKLLLVFLVLFLILGSTVGYLGYSYFQNKPLQNIEKKQESKAIEIEKPKPTIVSATNKSLYFGNVYFGRYIDDWSKASPLKFAFPFSGLKTLEREKYDSWLAGLECPITPTYKSSPEQEADLMFTCLPDYIPEAKKWFDVFGLANNHTDNMGLDGISQTHKYLTTNKLQYFSDPDHAKTDDICEVVSLPVRVQMSDGIDEKKNMPVAMCGYHNVFKLPKQEAIDQITKYSKYFYTIVTPHQGKEYSYIADELQETYAKSYIDAGADIVIGDHVHTVQNTMVYKDKLIVFSLGNAIFDQQYNQQVTQAFALDFETKWSGQELQKHLEIGEKCIAQKDTCLEEATKNSLKKLTTTSVFNPVVTDNSQKLLKKADSVVTETVLKRINWAETKAKLK
jgi:Bacterial capsule synthesis protein PGA_cap